MPRRRLVRLVVLIVVVVAFYALRDRSGTDPAPPHPSSPAAEQEILDAFRDGRSGVLVHGGGNVDRILPDDLEGSRHQRFIVRLPSGHTVLIAHNIDLAPRAPIAKGDPVEFFGEYEWNDRGGVVHWTHRDPQGRHEDGWIHHAGRLYQ